MTLVTLYTRVIRLAPSLPSSEYKLTFGGWMQSSSGPDLSDGCPKWMYSERLRDAKCYSLKLAKECFKGSEESNSDKLKFKTEE